MLLKPQFLSTNHIITDKCKALQQTNHDPGHDASAIINPWDVSLSKEAAVCPRRNQRTKDHTIDGWTDMDATRNWQLVGSRNHGCVIVVGNTWGTWMIRRWCRWPPVVSPQPPAVPPVVPPFPNVAGASKRCPIEPKLYLARWYL